MSNPPVRQNLEFLKVQYDAFMVLGLDIGVKEHKKFYYSKLLILFRLICGTYMQYGFINYVAHNLSNIDSATGSLSMFNQGMLLLAKVIFICIRSESMLKLIWDLNALTKEANAEEMAKWTAEIRRGERVTKSYLYACWISIAFLVLMPLILMISDYYQGHGLSIGLPFGVQVPFDDGTFKIELLNYIMTMLHVRPLSSSSIGIDTLFGWYIFAISGHFRILRIKINEAAKHINVDGNHGKFLQDMAAFVDYHNKTLHFVNDLNVLYGEILFVEISFSCLQICFHLYTISNNANLAVIPFHFVAFSSITLQVAIYCFGGEKIENENDMLYYDIYMNMPWQKMYPSEKKIMLLILARAQQQTSLIGLMFIIKRNLLVFIFRTAFSFVTLLGAVKEEP